MPLKDPRAHCARQLRRTPTDAERLLWRRLRSRALGGAKFRRETPLGPFIVDFLCAEARLVVEVDGGQHADSAADARRDAWLAANGYSVARYWNHEVLRNIEGVLEDIAARLARPLTPTLSRKGRGGDICEDGAKPPNRAEPAPMSPPLPRAGSGGTLAPVGRGSPQDGRGEGGA